MKKWNHGIESRISLAVLAFGLASSVQGQGLHNPSGVASALDNARLQDEHDGHGNNGDKNKTSPTPPGLYITPKALADAVQQDLNPGLAKYPNFVAGEAVKAVVSPDNKTLAILTAGMNSLYDSTGVIDKAASTQFLFLYDISGANKTSPVAKSASGELAVAALWPRDIPSSDICGQHDRKASVHASNDTCIFTASDYGKSFSLTSNPETMVRCAPKSRHFGKFTL